MNSVAALQSRGEQSNFLHRPLDRSDRDPFAHTKRPQHQYHDAGGDVLKGALQGKADGEGGTAKRGKDRCGFDAELAERGDEDDDDEIVLLEDDDEEVLITEEPLEAAEKKPEPLNDAIIEEDDDVLGVFDEDDEEDFLIVEEEAR